MIGGAGTVVGLATLMMVAAALPAFFLGVFAPQLTATFDVGAAAIGLLGSLLYFSAAAFASRAGDLVDRQGVDHAGRWLLGASALALAMYALAPSFPWLAVASLVAGVAMAASNPVTNVSLRLQLAPALQRSGLGIKQAGVPIAVVISGGALPLTASLVGWRGVAGLLSLITACGIPVWAAVSRRATTQSDAGRRDADPVAGPRPAAAAGGVLRWLAAYAFAMGGVAGMVNTFYVLYAVDGVGMSVIAGGWVAALMGLTGACARWLWAEFGGRRERTSATLVLISSIALVGTGMMWLTVLGQGWAIWFGAVLIGLSVMGWQGFVMYTVTRVAVPGLIGQASGRVMRLFYTGLLTTPIAVGAVIQASASYTVMWSVQAALLLGGAACALPLSRAEGARWASPVRPQGTVRDPVGEEPL